MCAIVLSRQLVDSAKRAPLGLISHTMFGACRVLEKVSPSPIFKAIPSLGTVYQQVHVTCRLASLPPPFI